MKPPRIPDDEKERLQALSRYDILDTPMEQAFDELTELAAHVAQTPIALVSLVDADRQWFKSRYGLDAPQTSREISFCGHVVASRAALVVEDTGEDERFHDNPLVVGGPGIGFYAGMPLETPDGFVLGTLCAIDDQPRPLSDAQQRMLKHIAAQVVRLLEQRRHLRILDRYRRLFDSPDVLPMILDAAGRVRDLNRSWGSVLGAQPSELAGKALGTLVHPDDEVNMVDFLAQVREEASQTGFVCRTGGESEVRWLAWTALFDDREQCIYALARDITTERRLERARSDFVSMVSHDLRTPLTSINGSLRLLEGGAVGGLDDDARQLVGVARGACDRLVRLVSGLLDLDRLESGRLTVRAEPGPASAVVEGALGSVVGFAAERGVELEVAQAEGLVMAELDRAVQILTNLLSNAITYSPRGGTVRVGVANVAGAVRFSVADEGPGIAPDDQARLFQRFVQVNGKSRGGSGFGLAVARGLTEAHHGRIGVDSVVGEGSTFWFTLPTARISA